MCLILFAWQAHPEFPLVVAANRDEFFARPTVAADYWAEAPAVLAGRDLEGGGTWMGITRSGRFAALTNYRDLGHMKKDAPSRGQLVAGFLTGNESPDDYLDRIDDLARQCNGFNLLLGTPESLWWSSNISQERRSLPPGVYGVSNHLIDSQWPKVVQGKRDLNAALNNLPGNRELFDSLRNDRIHPDEALPTTGVGLEWERLLSPAFIKSPSYGTRSSTTLICQADGWVRFDEQSWLPGGLAGGRRRFCFKGSAAGSARMPDR